MLLRRLGTKEADPRLKAFERATVEAVSTHLFFAKVCVSVHAKQGRLGFKSLFKKHVSCKRRGSLHLKLNALLCA